MKGKEKYLIKNFGIFSLSNFATKILSFIILPFYTFYLSEIEYAVIDLINLMVTLAMPILTLSINDALLKFALDRIDRSEEIAKTSLVVVAASGGLIFILMPVIGVIVENEEYKIYFLMIYFFSVLNQFYSCYMRSKNLINEVAIAAALISASTIISNFILIALLKKGIKGYFFSTILGMIVGNIYSAYHCKICTVIQKYKFNYGLLREMLRYSIPLIPNSLFWWINSSLDKFMLTKYAGLNAVGLYSVAGKIPAVISVVTSVFQQAWTISAIKEKGNKAFFNKVYFVYDKVMLITSCILLISCKLVAKILFQKTFFNAWTIVPLLVVTVYFSSLNAFIGSIYISLNKTKNIFFTTVLGAILNIFFNVCLIPSWGVYGAATATMISTFVIWIVRYKAMYEYICSGSEILNIIEKIIILFIAINVILIQNIILMFILCFMFLVVLIKHVKKTNYT